VPRSSLNLSSLNLIPSEELTAHGWLPVVEQPPEFDYATGICRRVGWTIGGVSNGWSV
jgi:hypothetical protein